VPRPAKTPYVFLCLLFAVLANGKAQTQQPPETPATFRAKVNVVLVPVVVRDKQGHSVGNLRREDFEVFDKNKPQVITTFSIEMSGSAPAKPETTTAEPTEAPTGERKPPALPSHFVAYLFDDVHLSFSDLAIVRDAAERHLNDSLGPADRAAVFTTSGQTTLDFTDDRAKLHETLSLLRPQPIARPPGQQCPDVSYYQADLIVNKNDPRALEAATEDALGCMNVDPPDANLARPAAQAAARRALTAGGTSSRLSLGVVGDVVRRLSTMPGQRSIILISPGFLTLVNVQPGKAGIIDRAIRANVIISSLDTRGLSTAIPGGDASQAVQTAGKTQYQSAGALASEDVLAELADGTGGAFFHNNNGLVEGFKHLAARPEYVYALGFSPQNLKLDGSFHALKVLLKDPENLSLQARRGYYAPTHIADPRETAREEIQEALVSREELHGIPVALRTELGKPGESGAQLAVLVWVDVKRLPFRKEDGRNCDDLAVVSALFDGNGNLVKDAHKDIQMKVPDQTLEDRLRSGIIVRNNFDVKPGSYRIRVVVRDSEGQLLAAANGAVEIP
jgi:VWFA-related protein